MITLLTGENTFESTRALDHIERAFDGTIERVNGDDIEPSDLPDILMGATLFSPTRLVVIKGLSENKPVWNELGEWLPRVSDEVHVVFVETKPDKRVKTYKELVRQAEVTEFPAWSERDAAKAGQWVAAEATRMKFAMNTKSVQTLVRRVGVDQWRLFHALEKLSVLDTVSPDVIEDVIEARPSENVFQLLDAALRGNRAQVKAMLTTLAHTDDPYMVFGLLSSQVVQLATLATTDKLAADVAKDIGAHPFAVSKLAPHARTFGKSGAKRIVAAFANADRAMKTTAADPWLLIERALFISATK